MRGQRGRQRRRRRKAAAAAAAGRSRIEWQGTGEGGPWPWQKLVWHNTRCVLQPVLLLRRPPLLRPVAEVATSQPQPSQRPSHSPATAQLHPSPASPAAVPCCCGGRSCSPTATVGLLAPLPWEPCCHCHTSALPPPCRHSRARPPPPCNHGGACCRVTGRRGAWGGGGGSLGVPPGSCPLPSAPASAAVWLPVGAPHPIRILAMAELVLQNASLNP